MRFIAYLSFFVLTVAVFPASSQAAYDRYYVGDMVEYRAAYEDTFVYLARDYNLGYVEMRAANPGVDPWVPGAGRKLILPTRHLLPEAPRQGLVINLPEMRLYAFPAGDGPPITFPLGIGRDGLETPVGTTKIARKMEGPTWRPTPRMRREDPTLPEAVPPGPENPMGTHALYLGWPQYAIHGTNRPFGIGRRVSSGCIRLYPEDIWRLYEMVPVGTRVTVVDQAIKVGWIDDELYIEAHPNIDDVVQMEESGQISAPKISDEDIQRILRVAGERSDRIRWPDVRKAVRERRGYPVAIARRSGLEASAGEETAEIAPAALQEEAKQALEVIYSGEVAGEQPATVYHEDVSRTLNP